MASPWQNTREMIVTTTPTVEGRPIRDYLGIVTGEAIIGANLFRDLFANIRDIVGGRSGSYERVLKDARHDAIEELQAEAKRLGANAVVAVDLDYEVIGDTGSMLMVSASGTAVRILGAPWRFAWKCLLHCPLTMLSLQSKFSRAWGHPFALRLRCSIVAPDGLPFFPNGCSRCSGNPASLHCAGHRSSGKNDSKIVRKWFSPR